MTFSTATNDFKSYTEKDVPALIADLKAADRVIGFNLLNFDYPVLKAYTSERLSDLKTLDLLDDIYNKLGFPRRTWTRLQRDTRREKISGWACGDSVVSRGEDRSTHRVLPRRCRDHQAVV